MWIHYLYSDLFNIPATHFSMDPGDGPQLSNHLSDDSRFHSRPDRTAIPFGSTVLAVKHISIQSKLELQNLPVSTNKRVWLGNRDPSSSRRTLRENSRRISQMFLSWILFIIPIRSMNPKYFWQGQAAADACAAGEYCQISGFIHHASGRSLWFSEKFSHADFAALPLKLEQQMQRSISAFETLAQIDLIHLVANFYPGSRMAICLKSLSDNSGAESVSNKCFTTTKPLCFFVEKLTMLASVTGVELDVSHIPGPDNVIADDLSRWDFTSAVPHEFSAHDRIRFNLASLWHPKVSCRLYPATSQLLWSIPT